MLDAGWKSVSEAARLRGDVRESFGRIVAKAVGPKTCGLLKTQANSQAVVVSVRHGVTAEWTVLGPQLPTKGVSIFRRARGVNHVRGPVERVVGEAHVRACGIIDVRQVADRVIGVIGVCLGHTPAVGQAAVGIIFVAEDFHGGLVELVGHAAILIVIPFRCLVLAVGER
jgi:hypothetical protein